MYYDVITNYRYTTSTPGNITFPGVVFNTGYYFKKEYYFNMKKDCRPVEFYNERIETLKGELNELKKKDTVLGVLKLTWAISGILAILKVFSSNQTTSAWIFGICAILFTVNALIHETIIRKIKRLKILINLNKDELDYLNYKYPGHAYNGIEYRNGDHNYSSDLDIFGEKGYFHYINRCVTQLGRNCLSGWLMSPADTSEIKDRQEAVMELSPLVNLRQDIASHGITMDDTGEKLESLFTFLRESYILSGKKGITVLLYGLPIITLAVGVSMAIGIPFPVFMFFFLCQVGVNKYYEKRVKHIYRMTTKSCKILKAYSRIIELIEKQEFKSTRLLALQKRLIVEGRTASICIKKISTLLEWFDTRNGMFHFLFNNTILIDLHCLYRIEKWRKETGNNVGDWFNVIGEFESLSSFACLKFNNPDWTMPLLDEHAFVLEAEKLGHPLIPPSERIDNDIKSGSDGKGCMVLITGPNMAGKSTFLRTIGLNIVAALAGAPVCADSFHISHVVLYTSMQTSDSLDKHLSLFYAELQRLKMIIDAINRREPVFFIIDEMLKGTNALDRQKGAIALLRQLMMNRANGITATHDLELTKLEQPGEWAKAGFPFPDGVQVLNFHFDGYVEDDKLLFDYKLKKGICESFNALVLMKKMGIHLQ